VNLAMPPLEIFESLTAILAETINENCARFLTVYWSIGGVALMFY